MIKTDEISLDAIRSMPPDERLMAIRDRNIELALMAQAAVYNELRRNKPAAKPAQAVEALLRGVVVCEGYLNSSKTKPAQPTDKWDLRKLSLDELSRLRKLVSKLEAEE